MTEQNKRQGQLKLNGKKAIPKPLCPKHGEYLKRIYTRERIDSVAIFPVWMGLPFVILRLHNKRFCGAKRRNRIHERARKRLNYGKGGIKA